MPPVISASPVSATDEPLPETVVVSPDTVVVVPVTLMVGVDVQAPHLSGGAGRVVRGGGCGGDRDQGSGGVFADQVTRMCAARVGVTCPQVPLPTGR